MRIVLEAVQLGRSRDQRDDVTLVLAVERPACELLGLGKRVASYTLYPSHL